MLRSALLGGEVRASLSQGEGNRTSPRLLARGRTHARGSSRGPPSPLFQRSKGPPGRFSRSVAGSGQKRRRTPPDPQKMLLRKLHGKRNHYSKPGRVGGMRAEPNPSGPLHRQEPARTAPRIAGAIRCLRAPRALVAHASHAPTASPRFDALGRPMLRSRASPSCRLGTTHASLAFSTRRVDVVGLASHARRGRIQRRAHVCREPGGSQGQGRCAGPTASPLDLPRGRGQPTPEGRSERVFRCWRSRVGPQALGIREECNSERPGHPNSASSRKIALIAPNYARIRAWSGNSEKASDSERFTAIRRPRDRPL